MKKSLFSLALIASSLLAVQAATVQIDFGRSDATTEGALNMLSLIHISEPTRP